MSGGKSGSAGVSGSLVSIQSARALVLERVRHTSTESIPVAAALGRVLANAVVSPVDLPRFESSAMDGYAVRAGAAASLRVVGEAQAGRPFPGHVSAGQAIRISTGAVMPDGADSVVPVERVELNESVAPPVVTVPPSEVGAFVRAPGEDVRKGQCVLPAGMQLGPAEMGLLAALGHAHVECARRPRVALAATGDELRPLGSELEVGQIYDSNTVALGALVVQAGGSVASARALGDDLEVTMTGISEMAATADLVCISGGVSVGPHDHVRPALEALGFDQVVWGVRLKPGKPFFFGVREEPRRQYAFGLPGNPVSTIVTFQLFVRAALRAMQGGDPGATRSTAILDVEVPPNPDRDQAIRCRLRIAGDGWHVEPTGPQGSNIITSMVGAFALALVPAGPDPARAGDVVEIELLGSVP